MSNTQPPAQFDWATELSDAQGHVTLSTQEAKEIGARLRSMGAKLKTYEDLGDAADDMQLLRMGYAAARLEIESLRARSAQPAGEYPALPLAITSAPERIWLDLGFNPWEEDAHFSNLHRPTWSADNATGDGIEYVRADRAMRAAQPAGAQQPGAAGLGDALEDAQRAINSMKVEAETAAQGDEQMMLEACETISNEGLQADMAIRAALASHGQAPAQDANEHLDLLAQCRSAFQIPERGDPLEVHWAAAMADPGEVPGYLQEIAARHAAKAAPAVVAGPNEAVKFADQSTADPVEKARRYLTAMGGQRTDSAYFCDDGFPRRESAQDALATLAVLEQLAAAPTAQPACQQEAEAYREKWDAELGRTAMRFVDRAGDVHPGIDDAETICADFYKAMSDVIDRMPHVQRMQPSMAAPAAQGDALDTMRLDWLSADESKCVFHLGKSWYTRPSYGLPYRKRASLREAIDAARAAQEGANHG